ncbi:aminodeoxychorismate lyase [Oceanithermus sp.]
MKRIAPVARKRGLKEARKGERAEWLRLSPEERWQAVEEMRLWWCRHRQPPCELGRVAPVARKRPLGGPGEREE